MNNFKIINWLVWLVLVILWNYSYPEASPFLDVIVAVMLSLLNLVIAKETGIKPKKFMSIF